MAADSSNTSPSFARQLWRWCFGFEVIRHEWWETLLFRCGITYVAWETLCGASRFHTQAKPHGLAAWGVDFTWIGDEEKMKWFVPLVAVCLLVYLLAPLFCHFSGRQSNEEGGHARSRSVDVISTIALLIPLWASFGHGTLGNSQGAIGHTTQIVTSALLAQFIALAFASLYRGPLPRGYSSQQLAADWTRQLLIATYVASAITKLVESHGNWLKDTPYFGLQVAKATGQAYYEWLQTPDNAAWLSQFLIDHPHIAQVMIGFGLPLELFAFLALYNRRMSLAFGLMLFTFHSTVTEIMHLGFVFHKILLIVLLANPVWWLVQGVRRFTATPAGVAVKA